MFAQLIAAMAHHGYLNLEGGQRLVEFIVKQCAVNVDEEVLHYVWIITISRGSDECPINKTVARILVN